jgi:hypothetical protein
MAKARRKQNPSALRALKEIALAQLIAEGLVVFGSVRRRNGRLSPPLLWLRHLAPDGVVPAGLNHGIFTIRGTIRANGHMARKGRAA